MDIPQQQQMTPEDAYERLQAWYMEVRQLKPMKSHEHLERVALANYYFKNPQEGTTRVDLGGGFDLKLQHSYNYKVDEGELDNVSADEIKKLALPWDDLFIYKPTLNVKVYRGLNAEQTKFVQKLLDISDGSPQLEIVAKADTAGQQKHVAAAEAQAAPADSTEALLLQKINTHYPVVLKAEQAVTGSFYYDGEDWWCYGADGEWHEVGPEQADEDGWAVVVILHKAHELAKAAKPKSRGRPRKNKEA